MNFKRCSAPPPQLLAITPPWPTQAGRDSSGWSTAVVQKGNATVHAAKRLGMGGYVHWDYVGDFLDPYFPVELGKNKGAGALSFL